MLFKKIFVLVLFISFILNCEQSESPQRSIEIIPAPNQLESAEGYFILNINCGIDYTEDFNVSAQFLKTFIENGSAIELKGKGNIRFVKDTTITHNEGYKLQILPHEILIHASSDKGAFYAVQTLRQLLPPEFENGTFVKKEIALKCLTITDAPRFSYRGMHLDVGRHMFSVDFIKKYIDALAMLKMNTFHWHLTEDQGWRIEIKKYPKLQEVAAYRKETLIGHYSDQPHRFDGQRYGGFYTQDEIKEIVAYATNNHVTIIPEIELPGHSQAAIAAYPELGCLGEQVEVATKWGVFEEIYCPKEETFAFLEDVLDEVLELFPSEYIHIGGDEAPKTRWKNCGHCQNVIAENNLKDEHELQSYFIKRIEAYLNSKDRQIIGWDEILEGGLAPNATVMSWRGINGAVEAAKQGHNVVMTPTSHCYFDYYQSDSDQEPLAIGGYLPLEKVYEFDPVPSQLSASESAYVLGAQGNVWTEYMPNSKQVEYMVFPRILAMSEVVWSSNDNKSYSNFITRLENFHKRLDARDIKYANHLYELEGQIVKDNQKVMYELFTESKGKTIRYTMNTSEPSVESPLYNEPIKIDTSVTIKAAVFDEDHKIGRTLVQSINVHKGVGKTITIDKTPHQSYPGSGAEGLVNGINGSDTRYGDKEWLGFWGEDIEITINLGEEMKINTIETRFHNGNGQWIYAPESVEVILDDGSKHYMTINSQQLIANSQINFMNKSTQLITLRVPNFGIIPEGKQGAGQNAWTFIDEIIIK